MQRLAIVGGGYSAVALILALAEQMQSEAHPLEIDVFEPRSLLGQGLAYAPWEWDNGGPLLNVPAGRMGPSLAGMNDFARWWSARGGRSADFAPRAAYGHYLTEVLDATLARTPAIRLRHHRVAVHGLLPDGQGWRLQTTARSHQAEGVVLAYGHEARGLPPGDWQLPGWWADPWACGEAIDKLPVEHPVLLIGSGLTAVDVWQRLARRPGAAKAPPTLMVSRHGWLPQAHRPHDTPPPGGLLANDVLAEAHTAAGLMSGLRQLVRQQSQAGADWRDVMADLRQHTPRLWHQLPTEQQRRAVRHGMAAWDSHRHRAAPSVGSQLQEARAAGRLRVKAGRLASWAATAGGQWQLTLHLRQGGEAQVQAAAIINCTGPSPAACTPATQLRAQGTAAGWYRLHDNGLGPATDEQGRMLDATGQVQQRLWLLGPGLRAMHWEATAVPELRQHAARLAQALIADLPPAHG